MKFLFQTPFVALILIPLLVGEPVWAQTPILSASDTTSNQSSLQLRVVGINDARIPAGSKSMNGFMVQVTNESGATVPEAAVAIRLPDSGSSGTFADGSHSAVVYTDNAGNARVDGIQWGETPGTVAMRITASKGSDHAGVLLEQTLVSSNAGSPAVVPQPIQATSATGPSVAASTVLDKPFNSIPAIPAVSVSSLGRKGMSDVDPQFRRSASVNSLNPAGEASVSIVSSSQEKYSSGGGMKKWIILGIIVAAGAGAGFAFAGKSSKSSSTTASSSSISFGSPTVSVGHP